MSAEDLEALNQFFFVAFTLTLIIGALRTMFRVVQYRVLKIKIPVLLKRDTVFVGGLAIPFAMIMASRAFGWAPFLYGNPIWIVATSSPSLIGVVTYAVFEFVIIDRRIEMEKSNGNG